jgi:cGMP-dependent protein kinase
MSTSKDSVCNDLYVGKTSKCHSPIRPGTCVIQPKHTNQFNSLHQSNEETSQDVQFGRKITISIIQASSRSSEHEEYKYDNINENIMLSRASAKLEFVQPEEMKRRLLTNTNCHDISNTFNFDENAIHRIDSRNSQLEKLKLEKRKITSQEEMEIKNVFQNLFLFDVFPDDVVDIILSSIYIIKVFQEEFLVKKTSKNTSFYIVASGILESYETDDPSQDETPLRTFKAWDYFGQEALILKNHYENFQYSVKCKENATVFVLKGDIFLGIKQKLVHLHYEERYAFLNTIIFFQSLDCIIKHSLADRLQICNFKEGEIIIKKGEKEAAIYLIKTGSVSVHYKKNEIKTMGKSTYVGIISVLMKKKRTLNVYAKEDTSCFKLTDVDLHECLGKDYIDVMLISIFREYIYNNAKISELINEKNIDKVFKHFQLVQYGRNVKINAKNKNLKRIMFVLEGNLVDANTMKTEYSSGSMVGEETLTNNVDISSDLMAYPDCLVFESNLDEISGYFGDVFRTSTLNFLHKVKKMQKNSFLSKISDNSLKRIIDHIKKERFTAGQKIIEEGTEGKKMYIIIKGIVRVSKNDVMLRDLEKNSFFGEIALLNANKTRTATVTALTDVTCFAIHAKEFKYFAYEDTIQKVFKEAQALRNDTIELSKLHFIKDIGKGKFGNVSLVANETSIYAIKAVIRRDANLKRRIAQYLLYERRIMLSLDHPFIAKMVKSFKNDYYVFFLEEYVNGMCMFDLLHSREKAFTLNDTRFYIASLLLVIDYLQKKQIVYRDFKPNNIMIDSTGYLKIIDFGAAKQIKDYTSTIIGTPRYIAPEILIGKGYSFSCDYWSIGVVAYEIFYESFPFGAEASEIMEIYNDIMYSNYRFPNDKEKNTQLNDFIDAMLNKQVHKRVCSFDKIKNMELFNFFDWDEMLQMQHEPPYKPNSYDLSKINLKNFIVNYENEVNSRVDFRKASLSILDPGNVTWAEEF